MHRAGARCMQPVCMRAQGMHQVHAAFRGMHFHFIMKWKTPIRCTHHIRVISQVALMLAFRLAAVATKRL